MKEMKLRTLRNGKTNRTTHAASHGQGAATSRIQGTESSLGQAAEASRDLERTGTHIGLFVIFFLASLPLMTHYVMHGNDVSFYLRLLAQGGWENVLYLPFIGLCRLGGGVELSYKLLLLAINALTTWTSYVCFQRLFESRTVGVVGCAIYTWAPYRLGNLYSRADIGEALAMTFLPLLLFLLVELLGENGDKRNWLWLALVYTLLLQSYWLSFLTAAAFTVVLCLVRWRATFRKATILALVKTVALFGVLNAWTAALFLYRFKNAQFYFTVLGNGKIQKKGVYLVNYLQVFFRNGYSSDISELGMQNMEPLGVGFVVTLGILAWLWMKFVGKYKGGREVGTLTGIGFAFAALSLNAFPWDFLQSASGVFNLLAILLAAPNRLIPIVLLLFTATVCEAVQAVGVQASKEHFLIFYTIVCVIAFVGAQYLIGDILTTGEKRADYETMAQESIDAQAALDQLDISTLDYAHFEGSRDSLPNWALGAEAASAVACIVVCGIACKSEQTTRRKTDAGNVE